MTTEQLDALIEVAVPDLRERLGELHPHILEAAAEALAATQENEGGGKPKVSVALKLNIMLSTSPPAWQTTGSVGVTYKSEGEANLLDDPDQPELAEDFGKGRRPRSAVARLAEHLRPGDSLTVSAGDVSTTIKGGRKS